MRGLSENLEIRPSVRWPYVMRRFTYIPVQPFSYWRTLSSSRSAIKPRLMP